MVSVKKTVKCKCGKYFSFDFNSDLLVNEITLDCKCDSCSSIIYATFSSMDQPNQSISPPSSPNSSEIWQSTGLGAVASGMFDEKPSQDTSFQSSINQQIPSQQDNTYRNGLGGLNVKSLSSLDFPQQQSGESSFYEQRLKRATDKAKIDETVNELFKEE